MKPIHRILAAATLAAATSQTHAAATMYECDQCSAAELSDNAATQGLGTRYVYDFSANQVHKYSVTGQVGSELRTVTEQSVESGVVSGFQKLRGVWLRDQTYYATGARHTVRIPTGTPGIGGFVNAAIGGTAGSYYRTLMDGMSLLLTDNNRVRAIDANLADALAGKKQVTVLGIGIPGLFSREPSLAAFDVQACDAEGNCAHFDVYSDGRFFFKGTTNAIGDRYPDQTHPATGTIPSSTVVQFMEAIENTGHEVDLIGTGASYFIVCSYQDSKLLGCYVQRV